MEINIANSKNKNIYKFMKDIFSEYRKMSNVLNNKNFYIEKLEGSKKEYYLEKIRQYDIQTKLIDINLNSLDKEEANILKSIYIENKDPKELNYSMSTYYVRLKKAIINFMDLLC